MTYDVLYVFVLHVTGIFTAPVDGVYLFSLFECSLSPQPASLSLHKNKEMIVSVAKHENPRGLCKEVYKYKAI